MKQLLTLIAITLPLAAEPLPSWNDTPTKEKIISYVTRVTNEQNKDSFIPAAERIAVFDNDGTLWAEQPVYFQLIYAMDMIRANADKNPDWKTVEPYASILKGDTKRALGGGKEALMKILAATHTGITSEEFSKSVSEWLKTARHPITGRAYNEMVYQPMLELLDYLRDSGFKTFIVSGGGIDFMRVFAEETYGIPPEQVIGSSLSAKYEVRDGKPMVLKTKDSFFIDDKEGKPVGIHQHIGRRPVFAGGNSDGDFEMIEWTTSGEHPSFGLIVHHTDSEREWAYDNPSHIGQLKRGREEAPKRGWVLVNMEKDWKVVFPKKE